MNKDDVTTSITTEPAASAPEPKSVMVGGFPKELNYHLFEHLDKKFLIAYLSLFALVGVAVFSLSFMEPKNELTKQDVLQIKKRYAQLELNKPEKKQPVTEKKSDEEAGRKETAKVKPKVDRTSESKVQRASRKQAGSQERAQKRESLKEEIESQGLFAALTAMGDGEGSEIDDVLAQGDVSGLEDIDISNASFTGRPSVTNKKVSSQRRGTKVESKGIGRQKIEKSTIKKIKMTAEVKLTKPQSIEGAAKGDASRTSSSIEQVMLRLRNKIKLQYEKYLRQNPNLSGKIDVQFVIKADGSVSNVRIIKNTLNHSAFERRLIKMIERMRFKPASGNITITYPFVFAASEA
ncbi:MAG: TonB family protein [Fibrobacteria bacterium]|nr:TonB family protein [Fibrobacteria bacterium]